ncbi:asparaginase [Candidatus Uhrbacteria bacterium]|nr:asparaginase [Candidatus Uhrbacteria bacterium]
MKKKILFIVMGVTIGMTQGRGGGALRPHWSAKSFLVIVPTLGKKANIVCEQLENLDSSNVNPGHWSTLARRIGRVNTRYDGIIVTHGTDTMAITATATALALGRGLQIPVVFTGSQLPLMAFGSDARFNLENSVKTVIEASDQKIAEVMIVFGDRALRAVRTTKISEASFTAFDSPLFPPLARISATGVMFSDQAYRRIQTRSSLEVRDQFDSSILVIDIMPGLQSDVLLDIVRSKKCHGLILRSLGAGNLPTVGGYSFIPLIKEASKRGVPIFITTKFFGGRTHSDLYEPGQSALDAGAIFTGDLTDDALQVKLMWALGQGYRSHTDLQNVIHKNFVGEVSSASS